MRILPKNRTGWWRSCALSGETSIRLLCVGGEGGRFADAEQEARAEEAADAGRDGGGEGGDAPEESADAADAADTEAVEQVTGGKLAEGVGPVVGAGEESEGELGDAEAGEDGVVGDGEVDAVEVVDEDAEGEQGGDVPASREAGGGLGRGWVRRHRDG